jgi:hypothetical protein
MIRIKVGRAPAAFICLGLLAALAVVVPGAAAASLPHKITADSGSPGSILLSRVEPGPAPMSLPHKIAADSGSPGSILLALNPRRYRPTPRPVDPMYKGPGEDGHGPDGAGANPPGEDGAGAGGPLPEGHYQDYTVPDRDTTGLVGGPAVPASPSAPSAPAGFQGPALGARSYRQDPEIRAGRFAPDMRSFRFDPNIRESRSEPPSVEQYQQYQQEDLGAATDFFLLNPDIGGNPQQATTDIYIMNPNLRPDVGY